MDHICDDSDCIVCKIHILVRQNNDLECMLVSTENYIKTLIEQNKKLRKSLSNVNKDKDIANLNKIIELKDNILSDQADSITDLNKTISVQNEIIKNLNKTISEQNETISNQSNIISERDDSITNLNKTISDKNKYYSHYVPVYQISSDNNNENYYDCYY